MHSPFSTAAASPRRSRCSSARALEARAPSAPRASRRSVRSSARGRAPTRRLCCRGCALAQSQAPSASTLRLPATQARCRRWRCLGAVRMHRSRRGEWRSRPGSGGPCAGACGYRGSSVEGAQRRGPSMMCWRRSVGCLRPPRRSNRSSPSWTHQTTCNARSLRGAQRGRCSWRGAPQGRPTWRAGRRKQGCRRVLEARRARRRTRRPRAPRASWRCRAPSSSMRPTRPRATSRLQSISWWRMCRRASHASCSRGRRARARRSYSRT